MEGWVCQITKTLVERELSIPASNVRVAMTGEHGRRGTICPLPDQYLIFQAFVISTRDASMARLSLSMPALTICGAGIMNCGRTSVRPLSVDPSVNTSIAWRVIPLLNKRIWMKLDTNVHDVSGHCWKGSQGQRSNSKVKVMTRAITAEAYISTLWCRGWLLNCNSSLSGTSIQQYSAYVKQMTRLSSVALYLRQIRHHVD